MYDLQDLKLLLSSYPIFLEKKAAKTESHSVPLIVTWGFIPRVELSARSGLFMAQPAASFAVCSPHGLFADVIAIGARHSPHLVEWHTPSKLRGWTSHTDKHRPTRI